MTTRNPYESPPSATGNSHASEQDNRRPIARVIPAALSALFAAMALISCLVLTVSFLPVFSGELPDDASYSRALAVFAVFQVLYIVSAVSAGIGAVYWMRCRWLAALGTNGISVGVAALTKVLVWVLRT